MSDAIKVAHVDQTGVGAQIRFVECTTEGRLRHAEFLGLQTDNEAREVRRE
jgi:ATP-dependent DNA ligase